VRDELSAFGPTSTTDISRSGLPRVKIEADFSSRPNVFWATYKGRLQVDGDGAMKLAFIGISRAELDIP